MQSSSKRPLRWAAASMLLALAALVMSTTNIVLRRRTTVELLGGLTREKRCQSLDYVPKANPRPSCQPPQGSTPGIFIGGEGLAPDKLIALGQTIKSFAVVLRAVSRTGAVGPGYSEGSMPYGISPSSNICDKVYCPQEGGGVQRNPRRVPTSPYAVTWTGYNWETFNEDVNVYEPSPCLAEHLATPVDTLDCEGNEIPQASPCNWW